MNTNKGVEREVEGGGGGVGGRWKGRWRGRIQKIAPLFQIKGDGLPMPASKLCHCPIHKKKTKIACVKIQLLDIHRQGKKWSLDGTFKNALKL